MVGKGIHGFSIDGMQMLNHLEAIQAKSCPLKDMADRAYLDPPNAIPTYLYTRSVPDPDL